ncbi:sensor histidine kinase [Clostridium intestinale]|uniref:sensor histidine kinase n=1 Tax=Clostridium intestinale TaxID=36845 RepID=UPI002DD66328|nr:GHKL domain-containing protein [Clostridium intestinale]WRY50745.1 GHKL domain-containing protein [Clostridium intestinale]
MDQYSSVVVITIYTYIVIINLSNVRSKYKEILPIVVLTILVATVLFEINSILKIIPSIIGGALYLYRNTKKAVYSIVYTLASVFLILITDYALCALYYMLTNSNYFGVLFIIVELISMFLVSYLLGNLIRKLKLKYILLNYKFWIFMMISIALILIRIYIGAVEYYGYAVNNKRIEYINTFLFFILFTLMILIIYILFRGITKEAELKSKQINFEMLQNYTTKIEGMYSDMRSFKHDYANIISSMMGYIDEEDMTGLKKHFYENILPLNKKIGKNDSEIGRLRQIKVPEIKGLLSLKLIRAQEMGIEVLIDIKEPIEQISMNIIDLTRVLGILLDNAIEATEECVLPKIKIGFIKDNQSLIIVICNRYKGDILSVDKLYKKGYSTKGANRGIGLTSLREIINKYETIYLDTLIEEGEFTQTIILDKNFKHSH